MANDQREHEARTQRNAERHRENRHAHKLRGLRGVSDQDWDLFGEATEAQGTDRSTVLRECIAWYLGQTDQLPQRPERT